MIVVVSDEFLASQSPAGILWTPIPWFLCALLLARRLSALLGGIMSGVGSAQVRRRALVASDNFFSDICSGCCATTVLIGIAALVTLFVDPSTLSVAIQTWVSF